MGQITVSVNGQTYSLACRDGDEQRLVDLCGRVDELARDLARRLGTVGEARLLLMVALLLADEVRDLKEQGPGTAIEAEAAATLARLRERVEGLAEQLAAS
ncbi:MAG: cell division protein ZapA [Rhodothalassiaceae bacterium]